MIELDKIKELETLDDKIKSYIEYLISKDIKYKNVSEDYIKYLFGDNSRGFISRTLSTKFKKFGYYVLTSRTKRGKIVKIRKISKIE